MIPTTLFAVLSFQATVASPGMEFQRRLAPNEIVRIERQGGRTVHGPYRQTLIVTRTGLVHKTGAGSDRRATLTPLQMKSLRQLIDATDFSALRKGPIRDLAPSAFDGIDTLILARRKGKVEWWSDTIYPQHPADLPFYVKLGALLKKAGVTW